MITNLLADIPVHVPQEIFETLLCRPSLKIERIISYGQSSPDGFWFDQESHEWVLLVQGAARLRLEGSEPLEMRPGSFLHIPAHQRHRVEWTTPDEPTIWLAIHYDS